MKRKYEVAMVQVGRRSLRLRVIVHEIGPTWSFELAVPYEDLDRHALYDAIAAEEARLITYESRHDPDEPLPDL